MDELIGQNGSIGETQKAMHAYCLYCETQRCSAIAELIRRHYGYYSFAPMIIQRKWVRGTPTEERHQWLPGYVFLYTEEPILPRFEIDGIIRCLGNGELTGSDLSFAEMLYRQQGVLGQVFLINEGDRCIVSDSSWQGMQGKVVKMDRGRKRCCIEFEFDETKRSIWVGYEMLKPDDEIKNH